MLLSDKIKEFVENYFVDYEDSFKDYSVLCPFHKNRDTPALFINKTTGIFHCFNPACGVKGNFHQLLERLGLENAEKLVFGEKDISLEEIIGKLNDLESGQVKEPNWQEALDNITINYDDERELSKVDYLRSRGFHPSVLKQFEVSYSARQDRIVIPTRDENYKLVGFIGRATNEDIKPKYKYSDGFPRAHILFNLQNAKNYGSVFICEGSLDAIKIHQAGFPNVVATLGASVSGRQMELLNKYFDQIIILSDQDDAGNNMKSAIISGSARKDLWVTKYPDGIKDPGDLNEQQIRDVILNKQSYLDALFEDIYVKRN